VFPLPVTNIAALKALLGAWSTKTVPYLTRIKNLENGVSGYKLDARTGTVQSNGKHNKVNDLQQPLNSWLLVTLALDTFDEAGRHEHPLLTRGPTFRSRRGRQWEQNRAGRARAAR
jgi:hypothetical protein